MLTKGSSPVQDRLIAEDRILYEIGPGVRIFLAILNQLSSLMSSYNQLTISLNINHTFKLFRTSAWYAEAQAVF